MNSNIVNRTLAIVFPGQGSQSVGMLAGLASEYNAVRETFNEASEVLGYDLWKLVQAGPEQELNRTDRTQPAMFVAGIAIWKIWCSLEGPMPLVMAGHSLGEYTALAAAGAIGFSAAVGLVKERATAMEQAVPPGVGAMAVILGLDRAKVEEICSEITGEQIVSAVNFNSPQQVVVAGHTGAVERVMEVAKKNGAKRVLHLPVSVPSHCMLMKPAAENFSRSLEAAPFQAPKIPVLYNVDVARYENPDSIRQGLARQLYNPVRWVETIQAMAQQGVRTVVECGPGKVLAGLNKRIESSMQALPVFSPESLKIALQAVSE